MTHRWMPILLLSTVAVSCGVHSRLDVVSSAPVPSTKTFNAHGISFLYPGDWISFDAQAPDPQSGSTQKSQDIVGLDDLNLVSITAQLAPQSDQGFSVWDDQIVTMFTDAFAQEGIEVESGPDKILLGGEKSLRWTIRQPSGVGYILDTTLVVMFRGDTEYFVKCQHTAARASAMNRGCDQVLGSFKVGKEKA